MSTKIPDRYDIELAMEEGWVLSSIDGCGYLPRIERFDEDPNKRFATDEQAIAWVEANRNLAGHYAEAWAAHCSVPNPNAEKAIEACRLLVAAFDAGLRNGGSVDWSDLDAAHEAAKSALGIS